MHKIFIRSFVSSLVLLFTLTVAAIAKDVKAFILVQLVTMDGHISMMWVEKLLKLPDLKQLT